MLSSRDPNGLRSGRDSRASNLSSMSRATNNAPGEAGGSAPKDPLSSTGVLSMLRTSTEMGNLGGTLGDGIGQAPRASQRRGASSRLSTASSMSNQSGYANSRIHQQRPPSSSGARHSMTHESRPSMPQHIADMLSPTMVNIPGSSPLVPVLRRDERHSNRSLSITNAMPHPERRLSNNRSLTSLRNEEADQRPRSPLAYPTRLRHAGYGSASSTWSDPPGTYPRRAQTPISQGPASYHGHVRRRLPSDASLGHQERGASRMLRCPSRAPSPAYYQMPNGDIPPVPPLPQHYHQYHPALEQTRMLHRSVQGSGSSGSTNLRTDSDTPSSDPALPPTPRDGMSMNMLGQPPINRMMRGINPRSNPMYYDYTEQFDAEDFVEPGTEPVPTGFVRQIKTVAEEPDDIVPPSSTGASSVNQNSNVRPSEGREIAELEASPVGRRITRELVQSRLEMTSTTGGLTSLASSAVVKDKAKPDNTHDCRDQSSTGCIADETSGSAMLPTGRSDNRHSILSQTGSSVLESSTLEFAVKCSIPAMTETSPGQQLGTNSVTESASPSSPEKNTDDGMSELIGGYQHTESKQEGEIVQQSEALRKNESDLGIPLERPSRHVQNSSDEQSFKSCTDVPEPVSPGSGNIQQSRPKEKVGCTSPAPQPSIEDADARSVRTGKDIKTPSRAKSMPLSQLPLAVQDAGVQPAGSAAGMPLSSPRRATLKTVSTSLSMSFTNKFRKSSKASIKETSVSTTDSSSTLGTPQQLPQVPPRDSSASLEAQRHTGVSKFLMFRGMAARLPKGKKTAPVVDTGPRNSIEDTTSRPVHQDRGSSRSIDQLRRAPNVVRTFDTAPTNQDIVAQNHVPTAPGEHSTPTHDLREDTTTDLRLSGYRYNPPQRYLHDLKEDSHEDSSLNTSASNLRTSHFRFPLGSGLGMRTSADDAMAILGKSSMGSRRGSVLEEVLNLPSLDFSHGNLFDRFKDALVDARFSRSSGRTQFGSPDAEEGLPRQCNSGERDCRQSPGSVKGVVEVEGDQELTGATNAARLERTRSPKLLMEELERMRIPSVAQLTQRFTELLPSLSLAENREPGGADGHGEFPEEEEMMEHALEEIHHVHPPSQKRSSARLRPMRGASGLVIMEDDVFEEIVSKERSGKVSGEQCVQELEFGMGRGEAGPRAKEKGKATTHTPVRQLSVVAELQTPSPAVLRPEHHTSNDRFTRRSVESALSLTRSPRSFVSTPAATDTRPWNFDKNYPWATSTKPLVDISLPPPAAVRQSPRAGPSHLRNTFSDATTSTFASSRTPTTSPPGDASGSNTHRQPRISIFGRSGDQAHAVGERYPTSALNPPTAIFRDHLSTCDTSDDDDFTTTRKANKLTLRKRFSSAARSNTLTHTTPRATRSKANPAELASPASVHESSTSTLQDRIGEARAFTSNRHTFRDAEGMRISAYHRHRIVDSIKRWWHKGGRLIRTISRRNSNHRNHDVHSARD
ncbi:hypothetical protein BDU57DRAFT_437202 [Ampelomyces quisqualis]|uniref:Uncharacterized protein n=1 Tax=Ampelomyces quisqualis TaxID=50730 RepID=A0A6A5R2U7_AMPQU|nr:hypothetical protein BDU57DRAFT_437202 [Ampelomyces quisqualis]